MKPAPYIEFLYRALEAALGIVVSSSNPERLRAKLYAARKTSPELSDLSVIPSRSNPDQELWILRKSQIEALAKDTPDAET